MALFDPPRQGSVHHFTPRGEMWGWKVGPDVAIVKLRGYVETSVALEFTAEFNHEISGNLSAVFFDAGDMEAYDTPVRVHLTEWVGGLRKRTGAAVHVYVRSKLVQMGAAVANLALGGILRFHPSKEKMEESARKLL